MSFHLLKAINFMRAHAYTYAYVCTHAHARAIYYDIECTFLGDKS